MPDNKPSRKPSSSLITAEQDPGGDYIVRATAMDHTVRAFACRTTLTCQEATRLHGLSPLASAALGRLMSGALMLAQDLESPQASLSAVVRADGPLQGLTAVSDASDTVRGLVGNPVVENAYHENGKFDVGKAVGKGQLRIIRDPGRGEPYVGQVALQSGEIAEDMAFYLMQSEQIPSVISLGVMLDQDGVRHAGGLMVQLMPDAGKDIAAYLESRAAGFPEVTFLLQEGFTPQQLIDLFIGDPGIVYHRLQSCRYACSCSRERMVRNLVALGEKELSELADDPKGVHLSCHFCHQDYDFDPEQLHDILQLARMARKNRRRES